MEEKNKAVFIIKKAQEDLSSGKISRREFNSIMMTFGAVAGYTLFGSFAEAWTGTRMRKSSGLSLYQILRSLRFRSSATAYLSRTPGTSTSYQKGTISLWCKKTTNATTNRQHLFQSSYNSPPYRDNSLGFDSTDQLHFTLSYQVSVGGGWNNQVDLKTTAFYRDPSAWYHIVVNFDTTQSVSSDRAKMWVNGTQVTSFATAAYPTLNDTMTIDTNGYTNFIGDTNGKGVFTQGTPFDGNICEFYRVDGLALTASSFGQTDATTGAWVAKKYSGTYGANGFYLPFTDTSSTTNLVKDSSGTGNHWTPNNISLTAGTTYDSILDTPTKNYAILNPLVYDSWSTGTTDGSLKQTYSSGGNSYRPATIGVVSGKWYCEFYMHSVGTAAIPGIVNQNASVGGYPGANTNGYGYYYNGNKYTNATNYSYGNAYTDGDLIGLAFDADNGKLWFSKNGTWQASGDPAAGTNSAFSGIDTTKTWFLSAGHSGDCSMSANFGQRPFTYSAPTGFSELHTGNLSTPTIVKPNQYFDIATYTGTAAVKTISTDGNGNNLVVAPDLIWIKSRSSTISNHTHFDTTRGVGNYVMSSSTANENYNATMVTSFNSNGFSLGTDATTAVNGSGISHVAWMWKKGVTPGFDIVTYTGDGTGARTIAHGLGVVPKMILIKGRTGSSSWNAWQVYHASLATPATSFVRLNETAASYTGYADAWNSTLPTSANFSVRNNAGAGVNGNGDTFVAYLYAEVNSFSKFGSYTGNGSTDGTFVYCGFRPRWIMLKRTDSTSNWQIYDTTREPSNKMFLELVPNSYEGENSVTLNLSDALDIIATGFKLRSTGANCELNVSGATYIFAAFAETPFKYATAR